MRCYICHQEITENDVHSHYKRMCKSCGDYNLKKRNKLINLNGYKALVTGGRIKIGYETALKLLRSGAFVVVTTRFPVDAVQRYSKEIDFSDWCKRLRIYQIDFRQIYSLFELIYYIKEECDFLDILINNAAQTVRHGYSYYEDLFLKERENIGKLSSEQKSIIIWSHGNKEFNRLQQSLDLLLPIMPMKLKEGHSINEIEKYYSNELTKDYLKKISAYRNSWTCKACDVSLIEMLEVQLVNVTTPFFLCTSVRSLMQASPHLNKYIVNVSAMEGKFYKANKNCFHPHTNMAKASLNMLTRTSAQDFATDGILMNSVDTGWITDENPIWIRERNEKKGLIPPLDEKDGASRLCDPIFSSIELGYHEYGSFLKDYKRTEW